MSVCIDCLIQGARGPFVQWRIHQAISDENKSLLSPGTCASCEWASERLWQKWNAVSICYCYRLRSLIYELLAITAPTNTHTTLSAERWITSEFLINGWSHQNSAWPLTDICRCLTMIKCLHFLKNPVCVCGNLGRFQKFQWGIIRSWGHKE